MEGMGIIQSKYNIYHSPNKKMKKCMVREGIMV